MSLKSNQPRNVKYIFYLVYCRFVLYLVFCICRLVWLGKVFVKKLSSIKHRIRGIWTINIGIIKIRIILYKYLLYRIRQAQAAYHTPPIEFGQLVAELHELHNEFTPFREAYIMTLNEASDSNVSIRVYWNFGRYVGITDITPKKIR